MRWVIIYPAQSAKDKLKLPT